MGAGEKILCPKYRYRVNYFYRNPIKVTPKKQNSICDVVQQLNPIPKCSALIQDEDYLL